MAFLTVVQGNSGLKKGRHNRERKIFPHIFSRDLARLSLAFRELQFKHDGIMTFLPVNISFNSCSNKNMGNGESI
jgi:hypothetical protein